MKKLKAMFQNKTVRSVAAATVVMAASGAAMAADATTGAASFDPSVLLDPITDSLMSILGKVLATVAGVFAAYFSATSGFQIVRQFLSKATR